ncbi:FAD-dependent oxidoreductase [Roseobacter sp. HKCCA0434]|uniref:FAD-dependent oxidoreductase n=1 Tax=Roseobacter sp. HKCCA0434 TaxID=3079297 RepID=UPI002905C6FB|nr:FAD-dependent oxidoreductase [Roseobacter sp. HKCCA0434]
MSDPVRQDVVVVGGGVAGLMATIAFGRAGYTVTCLDPAPPGGSTDLRSTAFLMPAVRMMEEAGLWSELAPHAAELRVMRLCDSGGADNIVREQVDFAAAEIGEERFGWNVPNAVLRPAMIALAESIEGVTLRMGVGARGLLARSSAARVTADDGTRYDAALMVAADGRNSPMREALGIDTRTFRYGQKAMVFHVSHPAPHHGVSTELHRTGGPFTLVPLPDGEDGTHRSAVVWMETGPNVARLMALDDAALNAEATARSCGVLGPLTLAGKRIAWPIISQEARALTGPHSALIAEAAHVMPPIGAQGLNTSFADIRALLDAAGREALGSEQMLDLYAQARSRDIAIRERGVAALNLAAFAEAQPLRDLRRAGLHTLASLAPLRRTAIRRGMGLA